MATSVGYKRVNFEGHTLNTRTVAYLQQVRVIYSLLGGTGHLILLQGSYNKGGVAVSGGTHDGGGALDIEPSIHTVKNWAICQKASRMCMGADWDRPPIPGTWNHHNHGIVIGDKEMSRAAAKQVQDYHSSLNGLASHSKDNSWRPNVIFPFVYPLPSVDLSNMIREAKKTRGYIAMPGVKQIQKALNVKSGTTLAVNGIFNKETKAAYKRWEQGFAGAKADGIPGPFTLWLLGAGRFNVVA